MNRRFLALIGISILALSIFFLASAQVGEARTIIVDGEGGGMYTSIQEAIDSADERDTIMVNTGVYNGSIVVNKTLTVRGAGIGNTVLMKNTNGNTISIEAPGVQVSDLTTTVISPMISGAGIFISADDAKIMRVHCEKSTQGIWMSGGNNSLVKDCILSNCTSYGMYLSETYHPIILNNEFVDNNGGLVVANTEGVALSDNFVGPHSSKVGVLMFRNSGMRMFGNNFTTNGIYFESMGWEHWSTLVIGPTNIVNSKQLVFYRDVIGVTANPEFGQLIVVNSSYVEVDGADVEEVHFPITIAFSDNVTIRNSTVSSGIFGIHISESENCVIRDSWIKGCQVAGIALINSENMVLQDNDLGPRVFVGIVEAGNRYDIALSGSTGCYILNNTCSRSSDAGMLLINSINNIIRANTVQGSFKFGMDLTDGSKFNFLQENIVKNNEEIGLYLNSGANGNKITDGQYQENGIGIVIENSWLTKVTSCNVSDNDIGFQFVGNSRHNSIAWSVIAGNGAGIIDTGLARNNIEATHNYWGSDSGPDHEITNPDGQGDSIYYDVAFDPWLDSSWNEISGPEDDGKDDGAESRWGEEEYFLFLALIVIAFLVRISRPPTDHRKHEPLMLPGEFASGDDPTPPHPPSVI